MTRLVIDASVAIKWIVTEEGTDDALALRGLEFVAPDLIGLECANSLWKNARRGVISSETALGGARALQLAEIELVPTRPLLRHATELALQLDHPAYDCAYLALAIREDCPLVTADNRLLRILGSSPFSARAISLRDAARRYPSV